MHSLGFEFAHLLWLPFRIIPVCIMLWLCTEDKENYSFNYWLSKHQNLILMSTSNLSEYYLSCFILAICCYFVAFPAHRYISNILMGILSVGEMVIYHCIGDLLSQDHGVNWSSLPAWHLVPHLYMLNDCRKWPCGPNALTHKSSNVSICTLKLYI